jgi:hypothetical protein
MASPYDVAIHLSLVSNVAEGLAVIVSRLAAADIGIGKLQKGLAGLKPAVLGAVAAFAGFEMIKGVKAVADHAKDLSHELVQIKKLNADMSGKEFAQVRDWAFGMPGRVPGTTSIEAAKTFGAIRSMFGKDQAMAMGDTIARFGQVLGNQKGNWDNTSEQVLKMIRAGDLLGKFVDSTTHKVDVGRLQKFLDLGTKVINATHGMVDPATWFQMAQQGGPALSSMTDEGLLSMAMAAQGMGGFRSGTAMTSLYQQMVGGKMLKYAADELSSMGLVGKDYEVTKGGHIVWGKGALDTPFTRMIQKDPLKATEIMREAMEKSGFTSIETQVPELFKILGRQTTQRLIHDFLRNMPQMLQERPRLEGGMGVFGSADIANQEDYTQVMHNAAAAWNDMMAKIGLPITVAAIPVMQKITEVFIKLGTLATVHPDAIANLATGITVLGAALMGGGGIAMLSALGPAGWIATGIIATGAAMALYKDPIVSGIHSLNDALGSLVKALGAEVDWKKLGEDIKKAFDYVTDALGGFADKIFAMGKKIWDFVTTLGGLLQKTSFGGGGFGGGGGLTSAAWSGGGGGVGTGSGADVKAVIDQAADRYGVNRGIMYGIIAGESAHTNRYDSNTRGESSWSMFQLNRAGGLGNRFERDTGLSVMNPANIPAIADWTAHHIARTHDLSPWRGYHGTRNWNPNWGGMGYSPHHKHGGETHVHNNIYLDGKLIAKSTSKRLVQAAQYPTSVGRQDGRGVFMSPAAEMFA